MQQVKLLDTENLLFSLKDVTYSPESPRMKQPFTVTGKVELFGIPFLAPIWVIARVTYPEKWWEEIIPIIGSPIVGEGEMALGGDFEITFPRGFDREGEFTLGVEVHPGPTYTVDSITLPPFPPVAKEETTFIVAGEVPPEELGFRDFRILSYSKNGGTPVTPPGVLELDLGDRCRVNVGFDHRDGAVVGEFHAAIWQKRAWDPHDEILNSEKAFSVPSSVDWEPYEGYIDIIITSAISPGTEYGLYVKIMGITGGDIFTEYLANVIKIVGVPSEEFDFDLTKPTASQTPVEPGTVIDISCPVTSRCTEPVYARVKVIIYEGSLLPGHGTKIKEYDTLFNIGPNESKDIIVHHATIAGTIDRRDVGVEVYVGGTKIKESEWDDIYYVTTDAVEHAGTISQKQLEYNESWAFIPAYNVPQGQRGLIHIRGRNDTASFQTLGIGWTVTDPGGLTVERHENDWASGLVGGGEDREFIGGRFDIAKAGTYRITIGLYMNSSNPVLVDSYDGALCNVAVTGKASPEVDTRSPVNITHNSATLRGRLEDTGYVSNVDVYFQFGKTSSYEMGQTTKYGMNSGDEGEEFEADITGLKPGTTYHYRAAADPVGYGADEIETGYGSDKTFTTEAAVVEGFTLRVVNPPAGAVYWRGVCTDGPYMPQLKPLSYVWEMTEPVPGRILPFSVVAAGPEQNGYWPTIQYDQFDFLLRDGKSYTWDFAAHEMREG